MKATLLLLTLFLLAWAQPSLAQDSAWQIDSSTVELRAFDEDKRQAFLEDEDFRYDRPLTTPKVEKNNWARFLRWIQYWWDKLFSNTTPWWVPVLILVVLLVSIIGVMVYLLGIPVTRLFTRRRKEISIPYDEMSENIHEMDFERLVAQAKAEGDYRKAVRLLYLESLKWLSDNEKIEWRINKTNLDYQQELAGTQLAQPFDELSFHFAYTWYGEFPLTPLLFEQVEQTFRRFQAQLSPRSL